MPRPRTRTMVLVADPERYIKLPTCLHGSCTSSVLGTEYSPLRPMLGKREQQQRSGGPMQIARCRSHDLTSPSATPTTARCSQLCPISHPPLRIGREKRGVALLTARARVSGSPSARLRNVSIQRRLRWPRAPCSARLGHLVCLGLVVLCWLRDLMICGIACRLTSGSTSLPHVTGMPPPLH